MSLYPDDPELIDPEDFGNELLVLTRYLDFYRSIMLRKAGGLTPAQLATRLGPSELTLAGLLKHLALVEDNWFQHVLLGRALPEPWASVSWDEDPDWEFHSAVDDDPDVLRVMYRTACERSRSAVQEVGDLDAMAAKANRRGRTFNLRWILIHMIEETARHAGHADLLRENIDGAVGD